MKTLENQMQIAKEISDKLKACDPYAVLAGGAPRDWYFGNVAKDLDFYVHLTETIDANAVRFKAIGLDLERLTFSEMQQQGYEKMDALFRIWEGTYKGEKVQVMCMTQPVHQSVVDCFGVSLCEFWWNGGDIKATKSALVSVLSKKMFYKDGYSAKQTHIDKMVKYFPDYELTPISELKAESSKIHKEVKGRRDFFPSESSGSYLVKLRDVVNAEVKDRIAKKSNSKKGSLKDLNVYHTGFGNGFDKGYAHAYDGLMRDLQVLKAAGGMEHLFDDINSLKGRKWIGDIRRVLQDDK